MKKKVIILLILLLGGFFMISHTSNKKEPINSITISYNDNLFIPKEQAKMPHNLVDLTTLPTNLTIELNYASKDNFAEKQIYPKNAKAYLVESTANKLMAANEELFKLGYRIKVYDAYRPRRYQYILREAAAKINPKTQGYIADPKTGSHHNRGVSVDITITDLEGRELPMPTKFDFFGPEASIYYNECTKEEKENRELLGKIMEKHGFRRIESEWWHFDDVDYLDYPLLDIDFTELNEITIKKYL